MEKGRILIADPGARGHAIADAYARSSGVNHVIIGPGNTGMIELLQRRHPNVEFTLEPSMNIKNPQTIVEAADKYSPELTDVAQDDALALGTVDSLQENGHRAWGPTASAARIEGSKVYSRNLMQRMRIPTPNFQTFDLTDEEGILRAMHSISTISGGEEGYPIFIKADGLAGGKGALRADNYSEAAKAIREMESFGEAGQRFVMEKGLPGREFSAYFICDGSNAFYMGMAADHKRALDGDLGGQTGGMGVVSPLGISNNTKIVYKLEDMANRVMEGTKQDGEPFKGILYIGGMLSDEGEIGIVEFNARWGDPEAQVLLPGLQTDYAALVNSAIEGTLEASLHPKFDDLTRVGLTIASRGYPGDYSEVKGKVIEGVDDTFAGLSAQGEMFSGGLGYNAKTNIWTVNGSRNITLVGAGPNLETAFGLTHLGARNLKVPMPDGSEGLYSRKDIGEVKERYFH